MWQAYKTHRYIAWLWPLQEFSIGTLYTDLGTHMGSMKPNHGFESDVEKKLSSGDSSLLNHRQFIINFISRHFNTKRLY